MASCSGAFTRHSAEQHGQATFADERVSSPDSLVHLYKTEIPCATHPSDIAVGFRTLHSGVSPCLAGAKLSLVPFADVVSR